MKKESDKKGILIFFDKKKRIADYRLDLEGLTAEELALMLVVMDKVKIGLLDMFPKRKKE